MRSVYEYPYTNYHDLNLDWIVGEIKNLKSASLENFIKSAINSGDSGASLSANIQSGTGTLPLAALSYFNHGDDYYTFNFDDNSVTFNKPGVYMVIYHIYASGTVAGPVKPIVVDSNGTTLAMPQPTVSALLGGGEINQSMPMSLPEGSKLTMNGGSTSFTITSGALRIYKLI